MTPKELKDFIESRQLNVKEVACELCVSQRTVYNWLEGVARMPNMAVKLLTLSLGCRK